MKKIIIGKTISEDTIKCNFCGETNKECFVSDNIIVYQPVLKDNMKLEWLKRSMFSNEELFWTIEPEYEMCTTIIKAGICKNCIKQLASQIK